MRIYRRPRLTRHVPLFITGVVFLWLTNGVVFGQDEDLDWLGGSRINPTDWFTPTNWTTNISTAVAPPTAQESASVSNPIPAIIGPPPNGVTGAVANELLIGATLTSQPPNSDFFIVVPTLSPVPGAVIVNGSTASLTLSGDVPKPEQFSLDVVNGSLLVENGATLTSSGSRVGGLSGATTNPVLVTVTGKGSSWTENGTLDIGSGSTAEVIISDGASFHGGGAVTIEPNLGTLEIGTGGLAGTFDALSVVNNGLISFNFTDVTTLASPISGSGRILKLGSGTLFLTGSNSYTGGTSFNGGIIAINNDANLGAGPLSFDGGTLEALANILSSKTITLNAGGGAFLADANTSSTLSGVISGPGSLTKNGLGTLILTGSNTYTDGTNINSGTVAVNSDLNLGTGPLSFNGGTLEALANILSSKTITLNAGGGTFLADANTSSVLSGTISGTGSLTKNGPGTLILTGTNTYSGGTVVSAGTLEVGNGGTTGSIAGNVTDNGLLTVNRSDSFTLTGIVSGTGSFQQLGPGTTIFTGNNTYTGGTTITGGTLQLGNGSTSGGIVGNVNNNGILAFDRSDTVTFNGIISGTGSLEQNGIGVTVLTANNSYTGTTTVNAGGLIVDGSISSLDTFVKTSGFLAGRGLIGGNLTNSGLVSPGDSPGTLTVSGNYTQNSTGTLHIEIAGLGSGQHDLLAVGGHATLGGTLQLVPSGGFQLHIGDKVTFLTANNGVSGNFSTIQNQFASVVNAVVVVLPTSVELQGIQGSFVPAACNPNSLAVAQALDSSVGDPRAASLITFLDNQPFDQLCSDFTLISPEQLTSIYNIGIGMGDVQTFNLNLRMDGIRSGSTGFTSSNFTLNGSSLSPGLGGPTGPEGRNGPSVTAPVPENRWGIFITGLGEFVNVDSTDIARGFDLQTGGFTLGVDYRIGSNFAIGLMAGYAHTNGNLAGGGDLDVNSGQFGIYATAFNGGFYVDTAVTGGISGYDSHRAALQGTASGNTNGGNLNVLLSGGYDWKKGNLSFGPTASFQYSYVGFNGFSETGSLAPLDYPDQHVDSYRTAFGGKASYDWQLGKVLLKPELRAAWQHEYGNSAYAIVAGFANGAGNDFTVSGPKIGRDSFLLGTGVAVLWNERVNTYIYYDGELGRTNYDSHTVTAGVRITF